MFILPIIDICGESSQYRQAYKIKWLYILYLKEGDRQMWV